MTIKTILSVIIAAVLLASCTKSIDEEAYEVYHLQMVKKGSHYCETHSIFDIESFKSNIFRVSVKLDTSLFVTNEGSYQSKLVGFSEDQIHSNSARVSYHTISTEVSGKIIDSLEFKTYVYNDGSRNTAENYCLLKVSKEQVKEMLRDDSSIEFSIELTKTAYLFQVNNEKIVEVNRSCEKEIDDTKFLNYHYYGGPDSIPAPQDMLLWVKYDEVMR